MDARERFILAETVVARPPLCPELALHLITDQCRLWRAGEAELDAMGMPPPYWAFAWPGGQALARYLLDQPTVSHGKTVLDFGAGGGIEALAALKAGAASALGADLDAWAEVAMRLNASLNDVELETTTADLIGKDEGWDVVLGGDVFYDRALAERVFAWLQALARRGATVLLGDPHRGFLPESGLEALATYDAPADVDVDGKMRRRTTVYRVRG